MSFLAGLILMVVDDEFIAWLVFMKLLNTNHWRQLYLPDTPKLYALAKRIRSFIQAKLPKLHLRLTQYNIILESLIASPFFTMFANLLPLDSCLRILDRFMLHGELCLYEIMCHLLRMNEEKMLKMMDCWDL